MKKQLDSMGFDFDWKMAVKTSSPNYYRHTQYIFNKMREKGLAYK